MSTVGPVSLKLPSCCFKLRRHSLVPQRWCCCKASQDLGQMTKVSHLMSSGTSAVRSRFSRMSQNMWNKSVCLWNQNCYIHTRTNTGRRGLDHGQLSSNIKGLHSPLAIFCQLSGLGQWLCGDSKGKPAELAYLILSEKYRPDGKSVCSLFTRSP